MRYFSKLRREQVKARKEKEIMGAKKFRMSSKF
jgi:hypothetical protein